MLRFDASLNAYAKYDLNGKYTTFKTTVVAGNNSTYEYKEGFISDTFGNSYDSHHMFDASLDSYAIFNLAGKYTQFTGSIATPLNAGTDLNMTIEIYADNTLIYSATGLNRIVAPKKFALNVTGVQQLKIVTSNSGSYSCGFVSIFNDRLVEK